MHPRIYKNVFAITPRRKTAVDHLDITLVQAARFVRFTGAGVWTSGKKNVVGIAGGYQQGDDISLFRRNYILAFVNSSLC